MKLREIAELVGGEIIGDDDIEITSVADISRAQQGQLAFFDKDDVLPATASSCVLLQNPLREQGLNEDAAADLRKPARSSGINLILVPNPKLAFAQAATVLHPPKRRDPERHESSVIADSAQIAEDAFIGAFTTIGENSKIGEGTHLRAGARVGDNVTVGRNCVVHPNVLIEDGCMIGDNVILHAGVVIGADGFGYVKDEKGEYIKFPQIGTVVIEDNVEIGANTCIDRGALGETRIGEGTKIDNLVQVGHNVSIGKRCVIAAQTGISGSVTIEDNCVIGGQVGFGDHVTVKSGAVIGSQAGVLPGKIVRPGIWWGTPIQPLDEYKRQNAMVKGLGRLRDEVKELKKRD